MADETILSWNVANWITVLIMVILGFAIIGFVSQLIKSKRASQES